MKFWNRKILSISILSALPLFIVGCKTPQQDAKKADISSQKLGQTEHIRKNDAGKTIHCKAGQRFTIELEGNATTGYSWLVKKYNENILKLTTHDYQGKGDIPGAPGVFIFVFEAIAVGKSEITLEYVRPWERKKQVSKKDTFHVNIDVRAEKNKIQE